MIRFPTAPSPSVRTLGICLCGLLIGIPAPASEAPPDTASAAPWTGAVDEALERLHRHLGVDDADLSPPRPWPPSELVADPVRRALEGPGPAVAASAPLIQLAEQAGELQDASELAFLLHSLAGSWLGLPPGAGVELSTEPDAGAQLRQMGEQLERWRSAVPSLAEPWRAALAQLTIDMARTRTLLEQALGSLDAADRRELAAAFDAIGEGIAREAPLTLGARLLRADRVDRAALSRALAAALVSVDVFLQVRPPGEPTVGWNPDVPGVGGLAAGPFDTPAGPIYLGGPGPNRWRVSRGVLIDFGGRDLYEPAPPADDPTGEPSFTVIIDLAGDDTYVDDGAHTLGAGRFGLGLLRDLDGDDSYSGTVLTQGAAWVGAGLLLDDAGDDLYRAGRWSQGAAGVGIGMLIDGAGADTYTAASRSQGYATTLGSGVLADRRGNDTYRMVVRDPPGSAGTGSPAGRLGQGAGQGHPEAQVGGGVGVLWDARGDDTFHAGEKAQGHGSWYAAGMLVDGDGDDVYTVDTDGQGHGARFGVGTLVDLRGDDVRTARTGRALGFGGDRGLGALFDGSGRDTSSCGGPGMGHAHTQGVALHLDGSGDDVYLPRPNRGCLGHGAASAGLGAWGLFADAGGVDRYAGDRAGDDSLWTSGAWGGGIDRSRARAGAASPPVDPRPAEASEVPELPEGTTASRARERLGHSKPAVRAEGARALGVLGGAKDAARLARLAREDPSAWVRGAASLALARLGRDTAGEAALAALDGCARPTASARECQLLVRAAASWLAGADTGEAGAGDPSEMRATLERIAALGPPETGALIMELIFDVPPEP